jgi:hypothetical protein
MLIAVLSDIDPNGRKRLVIGLEEENVKNLLDDFPIEKALDANPRIAGLEAWTVYILGPEDTARFIATYGSDVQVDPEREREE